MTGPDEPPRPLRVEVRPATLGDADGIARVHVAAWKKGYAGLLPADYLGALQIGARAARWRDILAGDGPSVTLVALVEGVVEGFVSVGPSRDRPGELLPGRVDGAYAGRDPHVNAVPEDPGPEGVGEIWAIYLHPDSWRRGLGSVLHEAGVDALREQGFREATLWVLAGNRRAVGFYESHGWVADGATKVDERDGTTRPEVRYRCSL